MHQNSIMLQNIHCGLLFLSQHISLLILRIDRRKTPKITVYLYSQCQYTIATALHSKRKLQDSILKYSRKTAFAFPKT